MTRPVVTPLREAVRTLATSDQSLPEEKKMWEDVGLIIDSGQDIALQMSVPGMSAYKEVDNLIARGVVAEFDLSTWLQKTHDSNVAEMAADNKRKYEGIFSRLDEVRQSLLAGDVIDLDPEVVIKEAVDFSLNQLAAVSDAFSRLEGLPVELHQNIQGNLVAAEAVIKNFIDNPLPQDDQDFAAEIDRLKDVGKAVINIGNAVKESSYLTLPQITPSKKVGYATHIGKLLEDATAVVGSSPTEVVPARAREEMSVREKFEVDRLDTMNLAGQYLRNQPESSGVNPRDRADSLRGAVVKNLSAAKDDNGINFKEVLTKALEDLEQARDAATGIATVEIPNPSGVPVTIRDARGCDVPPTLGIDASMMQFLNAARGALDVIRIEGKPDLESGIKGQVADFVVNFRQSAIDAGIIDGNGNFPKDPLERIEREKKLASLLSKSVTGLTGFLEDNGIPNALNKVSVAKDFQNLNTQNRNVVTVSEVAGRSVIEAEVALKGLTEEQQLEYDRVLDPNLDEKPGWYAAMPWWEQELVTQYAPTIMAGEHTIPTQLWQIVGMKNAFEKTTGVFNPEEGRIDVTQMSKHAGTLASMSEDKGDRLRVATMNAKQAASWIEPGHSLHTNTFNSKKILRAGDFGGVGKGHDPEIVAQTEKVVATVGGQETNTALNALRLSSGANNLDGARNTLTKVRTSFLDAAKGEVDLLSDPATAKNAKEALEVVRANLEPRYKGPFSQFRKAVASVLTGDFGRRGDAKFESALSFLASEKVGILTPQTVEVLSAARDLTKGINATGNNLKALEDGNSGRDVAAAMGRLSYASAQISESRGVDGAMTTILPKEELLSMCAQGKDRTGAMMHEHSSQSLSRALGVPIETVDRSLLSAGHTAQQAGGVRSCGSAVGCFGTRADNQWGLGSILEAAKKQFTGRAKNLFMMIEYASHGTLDHLKLTTASAKNPDVTIGGHPAETEHQKEVAKRKFASQPVLEVQNEALSALKRTSSKFQEGQSGSSESIGDPTETSFVARHPSQRSSLGGSFVERVSEGISSVTPTSNGGGGRGI